MSPAARQALQRLGRVVLWFIAGVGHLVGGGVGVVVMGGAGFMAASSSAASHFLTHCWWAWVSVFRGLVSVLLFGLLGKRGSIKSGLGLQFADGCDCGGGDVAGCKGRFVCGAVCCRGAGGLLLR